MICNLGMMSDDLKWWDMMHLELHQLSTDSERDTIYIFSWDNTESECFGSMSNSMDMYQSYMELTSKMSRDERFEAGHQLGTMLLDCSWQGMCCAPAWVSHPPPPSPLPWLPCLELSSKMSRDERYEAGHQLGTMLLDCSWQGMCCAPALVLLWRPSLLNSCPPTPLLASLPSSHMELTSMMSRDERLEAGHQLGTMLLDCSWQGMCCAPSWVL